MKFSTFFLISAFLGLLAYTIFKQHKIHKKPRAYTDPKKLAMLQKGIGANSQKFLKTFIKPGNCVLDIGCGTGEITRVIANMVGPSGLVVAVDRNAKALANAKKIGTEKGYKNIVYLNKATKDLSEKVLKPLLGKRKIDAVYSRLLLLFQKNPAETLQFIYNVLPQKGTLACEEVIGKTESSNPQLPLFKKITDLKLKLIQAKGGNGNIGEKLHDMFKRLGLKNIKVHAAPQARFSAEIGKKFIIRSIKKKTPKIVKHGLATKQEMDDLIEQIKKSKKIQEYIFPQVIQVVGTK